MNYDRRYSPNYNNYPVVGATGIIHATRSGESMNPDEYEGTINYMMTPGPVLARNPSSQWVIGRGIWQATRMVADNLQAWHAGTDNPYTWGFELEQGVENDGFTDSQLATLVDICRTYYPQIPARHAAHSRDPGFIGHQETTQGKSWGKTDPGHLFPWERFFSMLAPPTDFVDGVGVRTNLRNLGPLLPALEPGEYVIGVGIHLSPSNTERTVYP